MSSSRRSTSSGLRLASLALARSQQEREKLTSRVDPAPQTPRCGVPGQLAVRWERHDVMLIMWLSGALDEATVALLDRELDEHAIGITHLVVDLTDLEFIDATGFDALIGVHWRASQRSDHLSFRCGRRIDDRPIELTRAVRLRSRWAAPTAGMRDDDFYLALARACVDVGHPPPDDRPEAA